MKHQNDGEQPIDVPAKIRQYEAFVNEVLKQDLKRAQQAKSALQLELKEYDDLERDIAQLQKAGSQQLDLHVDLGGEVLAQAHVPDTTYIHLSIGLGFHVATTLDDAPRVIGIRKDSLKSKISAAIEKVATIRTHIKMTEEMLAGLQALK